MAHMKMEEMEKGDRQMTEHFERTEMEKLQVMERKAMMVDTPEAAARMKKMRLM